MRMALTLQKSPGQTPPAASSSGATLTSVGDPIEALRQRLAQKIFDSYCDFSTRSEMIRHAVNDLGLETSRATMAVDMELEGIGCANEHKLLDELEGMLRRFTDKDKKLDRKERADAIQMVCRARPGYSKGLNVEAAEKRVVEFCRAHQVKVKVGFLRWEIP